MDFFLSISILSPFSACRACLLSQAEAAKAGDKKAAKSSANDDE
jgi:hypothetical protein